jgi:hypothetical protein
MVRVLGFPVALLFFFPAILIFVLREKTTEKRCLREIGRKVDGTLPARDGPEGEILVGLG